MTLFCNAARGDATVSIGRTLMTSICRVVLVLLYVVISTSGQQIASVDLRRPAVIAKADDEKDPWLGIPAGCGEKLRASVEDGSVIPGAPSPKQIKVSMVGLNGKKLGAGTEVETTVKLENESSESIQIPWSTNYKKIENDQDLDNGSIEDGSFRITLTSRLNNTRHVGILLRDLFQGLVSSKFVSGSELILEPGKWITAQIRFKVEEIGGQTEPIKKGEYDLRAEWRQAEHTRKVNGCDMTTGYFDYYYNQNKPAVRSDFLVLRYPPQSRSV
jgi:hypothetical protein